MRCVLRAGGKELDVDEFIKGTTLLPCAVFRKGELIGSKNLKCSVSGLNIEISTASFDNFEKQIKDAVKFLKENKREITKIAGCYLKREGGSHSLWINPKNGVIEAVPRHIEIKDPPARKI